MKKKNIIIVVILLIFTLLLIGVGIYLSQPEEKEVPPKKEPPTSDEEKLDENQRYVVDKITKLNEYIVDPTKTRKDFAKLTNNEETGYMPIVGKESSISYGIPSIFESKVKNKLGTYITAQKKYIKSLEKEIQKTYKYKLIGEPVYTLDKKQLMQQLEVTPFNYTVYLSDVGLIQTELLKLANKENLQETAEDEIYRYQSRVKAIEILDSQLDIYKSKETHQINIVYDLLPKKQCYSCNVYMDYAIGNYSSDMVENGQLVYIEKSVQRIQSILETAKTEKILDVSNPLKLSN